MAYVHKDWNRNIVMQHILDVSAEFLAKYFRDFRIWERSCPDHQPELDRQLGKHRKAANRC
jgi:hypothetical protein